MSLPAQYRMVARRRWPVRQTGALLAATAVVLAGAAAVPSGAAAASPGAPAAGSARAGRAAVRGTPTPTEVIDAQKDPDGAAKALSEGCQDLSKCSWQTASITADYGPQSILGDVLYNCSTDEQDNAETAVGVSDERAETTSVSEKLSVKLQGGLIGLASASAEFEAFSKQSETFSTSVSTTNAVAVQPGWKGYTTTQVLSANVTGDTYITAGINKLIEVKGIDLSFPGYQDNQDGSDAKVIYNGISAPMTTDDIATRCNAVSGGPSNLLGGIRRTVPTGSFKLTLCLPRAACVTRKVTGPPPPDIVQATVTLSAGGRIYAAGSDTAGRIRLTVRRPIKAGKYTLSIRQSQPPSRRQVTYLTTTVPITIR